MAKSFQRVDRRLVMSPKDSPSLAMAARRSPQKNRYADRGRLAGLFSDFTDNFAIFELLAKTFALARGVAVEEVREVGGGEEEEEEVLCNLSFSRTAISS